MTRRVLVTGANKGIGLAIGRAILEQHDDAYVFLGSRDASRGEAARNDLVRTEASWADRVAVVELDVTRDDSVAAASERVAEHSRGEALWGIVNNAGIGLGDADLRGVFEVNTLGVMRVCDAFIPLVRPEGGRIVNVTSASGPDYVSTCSEDKQRFFLDRNVTRAQLQRFIDHCLELHGPEAFAAEGLGDGNPYGLSKACANLFTLILAREQPALRVHACTPGYIETDLTRPYAEAKGVAPAVLGMKPPAEGTRAPVFLLFGDPDGTGHYYGSDAQRSPLDRYRAPGTAPHTGEP